MTKQEFEIQVERLNSQWPNGYRQERKALLWSAFQNVPIDDFQTAISFCITNCRGLPLLPEIDKAVNEAKAARFTSEVRGRSGIPQVLNEAADNNKTAEPEFVRACLKLLDDRTRGKLTMKQFLEGCDYLDEVARTLSPRTETNRRPPTPVRGNWGTVGEARGANND